MTDVEDTALMERLPVVALCGSGDDVQLPEAGLRGVTIGSY